MKLSGNKKNKILVRGEVDGPFVKFHEILAPVSRIEETVSLALFVQLFEEADLEKLFSNRIFGLN